MKRILTIATYPIKNPQHGGQKRVAAIGEQYRKAGHIVHHTAIYIDAPRADVSSSDIQASLDRYRKHPLAALIGDVLISEVLQEDEVVRARLKKLIQSFRPDIVEVEQIFLYKTVKMFLDEIGDAAATVNSTQNIESPLKEKILTSFGVSRSEIKRTIKQINSLESYAAKNSSWSIACTEHDSEILKKIGAKEVIVAPNGISREEVDQREVEKLKKRFGASGVGRIILFVGSAHPPNLTGYADLVGGRLGFMEEDTRLVVVGGIADLVYDYAQKLPNYIRTLFMDHVVLLGRVEEKTLTALLRIAEQVILPIMEGGGSNLKTAEAILADKKVVATSKSFHSYEKYIHLPNLIIADSSDEFIKGIYRQLNEEKKTRSVAEEKLSEGVMWENTLVAMVDRVSKI